MTIPELHTLKAEIIALFENLDNHLGFERLKEHTFFKGYQTFKNDFLYNAPKGAEYKLLQQRLYLFIQDCIDNEITRLQTIEKNRYDAAHQALLEKQAEIARLEQERQAKEKELENLSKQTITNQETEAAKWFEIGYEATDSEAQITAYSQAIALKPDHAAAYNNRGVAKNNLGKYQEAIIDYDKAIQLNSDYIEAYYNRGIAKKNLGKSQEAIIDYDKAIQLKPDYAAAYNNRGLAKKNLGKYQEAIIDYDKSIELNNPELHLPYHNRGIAKNNLGKYQEAIIDYDKAIQLNSNNADVYWNRAVVCAKLKKKEETLQSLKEAIRLNDEYKKETIKYIDFFGLQGNSEFEALLR